LTLSICEDEKKSQNPGTCTLNTLLEGVRSRSDAIFQGTRERFEREEGCISLASNRRAKRNKQKGGKEGGNRRKKMTQEDKNEGVMKKLPFYHLDRGR